MTKEVFIGGKGITKRIGIGGNNPVTIQTMWKDSIVDVCKNTTKLESILKQINDLSLLGCDIIRFAVPQEDELFYSNMFLGFFIHKQVSKVFV